MLIDFQEHADGDDLSADVCIIGSGAAGITLAMELDGSGHDVLLVTGGAIHHEPEAQDLYRSQVVGLKHLGIHDGRAPDSRRDDDALGRTGADARSDRF